jgi:sec-independent protein translocase protein TatA
LACAWSGGTPPPERFCWGEDGESSMGLSWPHILIALLVFVLLFGTGKISALMGDVAKGIKGFKKGLTEEWKDDVKPEPKVVDCQDSEPPARATSVRRPKLGQKLGRAGF